MKTIRLTTAQAIVRWLLAQRTRIDDEEVPLFAGVFAIFGHGNVTCLGEALEPVQDELPTWRGHNEQSMALAAVAYAKAMRGRRIMIATSSIGPGSTNMVTAAAVAHANRLPVLLFSGDTFQHRIVDPVLQQVEHFGDPTITVADAFKPVTRYWDRITQARADHPIAAPGAGGHARPGDARAGVLRPAPGRPGGCVRLPDPVLRAAGSTTSAGRARIAAGRRGGRGTGRAREEATDHRRRRRPLLGRRRHPALVRGAACDPGRRDRGRQGDARREPPELRRPDRRDRIARRQRRRRTGRRRPRRRHAAAGLHDRLVGAVQRSGRPLRRRQHRRLGCPQAERPTAHRRREGVARGARRGARHVRGAGRLARLRPGTDRRVARLPRLLERAGEHEGPPAYAEVIQAINDAARPEATTACPRRAGCRAS